MQLPICCQTVMFALSVAGRLRDNHEYELPNFTRFQSLTLKMMVKDVDDLDKNWHMNFRCQRDMRAITGDCTI